MPSKKYIVITSIFEPTEAVREFAARKDWEFVVVGDKKTPPDWKHDRVHYLSPQAQEEMGLSLTGLLPWNHYCRKMVGYLYAIKEGAEFIADTDDDNIPLTDWGLPEAKDSYDTVVGHGFVNIYSQFTNSFIWPRGLPLNQVLSAHQPEIKQTEAKVGVWQFLADDDPDVDAIYRLTINKPVKFKKRDPIVLDRGIISPFNSQNTIFTQETFPLLYLPAFVTFRFTDILRGLIAQPALWSQGLRLAFGHATVRQERNDHDFMKDFESEVPVYLHSEEVVRIARGGARGASDLKEALINTYSGLLKADIVEAREMALLFAWLSDLERLTKAKV